MADPAPPGAAALAAPAAAAAPATADDYPAVHFQSTQSVLKGEDFVLIQPSTPWPGSSADAAGRAAAGAAPPPGRLRHKPADAVSNDGRAFAGRHAAGPATFGLFCVFDGHNGGEAARHCASVFHGEVLARLPRGDPPAGAEGPSPAAAEWRAAVQRAVAAAFAVMQHSFAATGDVAGTTATVALLHGWTLTAANVGDSLGYLDVGAGAVTLVTADHRVSDNAEERARVRAAGAHVAGLSLSGAGPAEDERSGVGALRIWPGGVMNSRAIGDFDVALPAPGGRAAPLLLASPSIVQLAVPRTGGRLVLASDGVWDVFAVQRVAQMTRRYAAAAAPGEVVSRLVRAHDGLRDDTTLVVVDVLPPGGGVEFPAVAAALRGAARRRGGGCCGGGGAPPPAGAPPPPRPAVLSRVDVARVLGQVPRAPGGDGEEPPRWYDAALVAALRETQADASALHARASAERQETGAPPPRMPRAGSRALLDYFGQGGGAGAGGGGGA